MKQKLFVLSMDAMVYEDLAYMMKKPNFSKLFSNCAQVEQVQSIFPAVTYPAHTTLATGCYPAKHGIFNNYGFKTYQDHATHWYLDSKLVKVEDIFAAAKRAGCTTASVYWPITGNNPNVDYIINEYFFFYPEEDTLEAFARMGAKGPALDAIRENMELVEAARAQKPGSDCDDFAMGCVCSLIRNAQPDVMLVHNSTPDTYRHRYGVFGEQVLEALDQTDAWLGDVMQAMMDAGTFEDTNFVLLSDHGQMDVEHITKLNTLLVHGGFIERAPDTTLYDWQAFAQSNGMSAAVFLRDPNDRDLHDRVHQYLQKLVDEGTWGLARVDTVDQVHERYHSAGPYSFMVYGDGKTYIGEGWREPVIQRNDAEHRYHSAATHGYEPQYGPQPIFLGRGPAFQEGACIPRANLVDIAPTLAAILGQELPQADGCCLRELLK